MAIVKGPAYKIISTPFGMIGFGPLGKANVDENICSWLKEKVKEGKLSDLFFEDEGQQAADTKKQEETSEPKQDEKEEEAKAPSKKRGRKKAK